MATQDPNGEVEFQVGAMTASEDNLILLRNKLKNPPLRALFDQLALKPAWVEEQGRVLAYLDWPLELRGAVHRLLFPNGAPGAGSQPLPPTPIFPHRLLDLRLASVTLDLENCMPDELLYKVHFELVLEGMGPVNFDYAQIVWSDRICWADLLTAPSQLHQAEAVVQLLFGGLIDPLRGTFGGHEVQVLAEAQPQGLTPGCVVDELALPGEPERHLGEEIETMLNQRRLQPMLRDSLLAIARSRPN